MKPVIGIVTRMVTTDENNTLYGVYDEISHAIKESGGIPIGIMPMNIQDVDFSLIDGLVFQGGDDFTTYEQELVKYAYEHNIKTLGICLGMQLMGCVFGGNLVNVVNHKEKLKNYVHHVKIMPSSFLYKIFKQEEIIVNSRHKCALEKTNLCVSGVSSDNIIEAIEDKSKDFFVGVQWHPESMFTYDNVQKELFNCFINLCRRNI